jgi:hypothetical protein
MLVALTGSADAFWRMNCSRIQMGCIDPIIKPRGVAGHSHTIYGPISRLKSTAYANRANRPRLQDHLRFQQHAGDILHLVRNSRRQERLLDSLAVLPFPQWLIHRIAQLWEPLSTI